MGAHLSSQPHATASAQVPSGWANPASLVCLHVIKRELFPQNFLPILLTNQAQNLTRITELTFIPFLSFLDAYLNLLEISLLATAAFRHGPRRCVSSLPLPTAGFGWPLPLPLFPFPARRLFGYRRIAGLRLPLPLPADCRE